MEFTVKLEVLQRAMKILSSVARVNTDDIIGQAVLDIRENGDLVMLCNNGSLSLTHLVTGCNVKTPGVQSISYGKLSSFVNSFPPLQEGVGVKEVKFKLLKNDLSVSLTYKHLEGKQSNHRLKLRYFPANKMPVPTAFTEPTVSIPSGTLRLAISKIIYAVNPASIRSYLQGVNMNFDEKNIHFAGTDAQVLSEYSALNTTCDLIEGSYILSYNFVMALRKVIDAESEVEFELKDDKIKARVNTTTLHGSLIVGESFPDYYAAFTNFNHEITVNKDIMLGSFLPFLNTLDSEDHNRLTISINDQKLVVSSDHADSEYSGDIDFEGEFAIDVNGSSLSQTLTAIMDDTIVMRFSDEVGSLIFDSEKFKNQKGLVTPIRRR